MSHQILVSPQTYLSNISHPSQDDTSSLTLGWLRQGVSPRIFTPERAHLACRPPPPQSSRVKTQFISLDNWVMLFGCVEHIASFALSIALASFFFLSFVCKTSLPSSKRFRNSKPPHHSPQEAFRPLTLLLTHFTQLILWLSLAQCEWVVRGRG